METTWQFIFEGNLETLFLIEKQLLVDALDLKSTGKLFYTRLMIAFYRQDAESMTKIIEANTAVLEHDSHLRTLSELRLMLRMNSADLSLARKLVASLQGEDHLMRAEGSFICAGIHQCHKSFDLAEQYYREATALYEKAGSIRKSLRANLCSLAAYSCLKPQSRLFAEYMSLYRKALDKDEQLTASVALINISREFQRLGGLGIALDYASRALHILEQVSFGSREHGLCLVHRAHIYLEFKRMPLAKMDLMHALTISNNEVQSALQVLSERYELNLKSLSSAVTLPTWQERKEEKHERKAISMLEEKVILLLSQKPCTKFDLMKSLYGDAISIESSENRLKNLMSRLRSRFPNLIYFENGHYHLMEPEADGASA